VPLREGAVAVDPVSIIACGERSGTSSMIGGTVPFAVVASSHVICGKARM